LPPKATGGDEIWKNVSLEDSLHWMRNHNIAPAAPINQEQTSQ
jgi:hypothetical protein